MVEKNGHPQLVLPESQSTLRQIEFSLEYGQTYDPVTKALVTQIVGLHIDCPWYSLSSMLGHPGTLNYLSASRIPPLYYNSNGELDLPAAPNENQFSYMEWRREWYWESDFGLEQLALQYDPHWRDVVIDAVEGFCPILTWPERFTNTFYYGQNDFLSHRLNGVIEELRQSIKKFLDAIEYLCN